MTLIVLAPMEGVIDYPMRRLLTDIGGYDRCVTEFVRVTDVLLPERVFHRLCPELNEGGVTASGTPVRVQLLGSHLQALALNAARAVELGAPGVDINFGCPAKTVNRSDGGSVLLQEPARVGAIVDAVRQAVPGHIPVSAKIRLGFESPDAVDEIIGFIIEAGASEICVHARTKADGYKPPAYWHRVKNAQHTSPIPILINGEIWSVPEAYRAMEESGCQHIMLGRGALSCPDLALQVRHALNGNSDAYTPMAWSRVAKEVQAQFDRSDKTIERHVGNRTKQWLAYLRREYQGAEQLFGEIKRLHAQSDIESCIAAHVS